MELSSQNLSSPNVGRGERLMSLVAGGALFVQGMRSLRRRQPSGIASALAGGVMLGRALTGHSDLYRMLGWSTAKRGHGIQRNLPLRVEEAVVINRSPAELYHFWSNLENLPRFMTHLKSVTMLGNGRSHWVAKAPAGTTVEWDARIINDIENELIAWESLPGASVAHAGSVHFNPGNGEKYRAMARSTELRVVLRYDPPAGVIGATVAELFSQEPSQQIAHDLRRFKVLLETGGRP